MIDRVDSSWRWVGNLRGGGKFGSAWYEAAVGERKQTTFEDLIAGSEHLIAQG